MVLSKADAVIFNGQLDETILCYERQVHQFRLAVFDNVVQRLLKDSEDSDLKEFGYLIFIDGDLLLDANVRGDPLVLSAEPVNGGQDSEIIQNRWAQITHYPPGLFHGAERY